MTKIAYGPKDILMNPTDVMTIFGYMPAECLENTWQLGLTIDHVIFNGPATIVFWADGTKTIVKCRENDSFNPRVGILYCLAKKVWGNTTRVNRIFTDHIPEDVKSDAEIAAEILASLLESCQETDETDDEE